MFKRNRMKRKQNKHSNKIRSLLSHLIRSYIRGKGGKVPYNNETLKDIQHFTSIALDYSQRLLKEKQ